MVLGRKERENKQNGNKPSSRVYSCSLLLTIVVLDLQFLGMIRGGDCLDWIIRNSHHFLGSPRGLYHGTLTF